MSAVLPASRLLRLRHPPPPPRSDLNCTSARWQCMFPAGLHLQARDRSGPRRTRTASPGSECSPSDLNCKLVIAVVPAGPEQQAQDKSDTRRTSTASSWSQWSPPDLNHKESPKIYQIECQKECQKSQKICQIHMPEGISERMPERMPEWMPEKMPDRMSEKMPDRMLERMSE